MSIVTKSIVNADAFEARYLSPGELDRIKNFVTSGERLVPGCPSDVRKS